MKTNMLYMLLVCAPLAIISCNKKGEKGDAGASGTNGKSSLVRTTVEPKGANCTYGGVKVETGLDVNSNSILDDNEVITAQTKYVCNNTPTVFYSDWFDATTFSGIGDWKDTLIPSYHRRAILFTSAITRDVYDKGVVLVYMEDNYSSTEPIISQLPYRVSFDFNDYDDFKFYISVGKIMFTWQAISNGIINLYPLAPNVRYRYIIIPEGTRLPDGGRVALSSDLLKGKPYDEVAKFFNIPTRGSNIK